MLGEEAFSGLTVGRLEIVNSSSIRRISDTAFHSTRVLTLVLGGCSLERLTKASMRGVADSLRELVVANNTRRLILDPDVFELFRLRRLVLANDQLDDAGFLVGGDHDEIVLDNNDRLWTSTALTSSGRKRTRRLSLRNTSIASLSRTVDISMFADAEELNLSFNKLGAVTASELRQFDRLRALDLRNNSVDQLIGNFTSILPRLDTVDLRNNRLETLPETSWRPLVERLKSAVLLDGNRLHFNCEMRWLADQKNLALGPDAGGSFRCTAPVIQNASVQVIDVKTYILCFYKSLKNMFLITEKYD